MPSSKTLYLGANFSGHDSAIFAVFPDEHDVFAIATERITRFKHDKLYALPAIKKMLDYKKINPADITKVYFANGFLYRKEERLGYFRYELLLTERKFFNTRFEGELAIAKKEFMAQGFFTKLIHTISKPSGWLLLLLKIAVRLKLGPDESADKTIRRYLKKIFPNAELSITYHHHQSCHALTSYLTSPFENALLVSFDGWGDDSFSKVFITENGLLKELASSPCDTIDLDIKDGSFVALASPAGIYAYITYILGYKPLSEEGKVEAIAAYGNPDNDFTRELLSIAKIDHKKLQIDIDHKLMYKILNYERIQNEILPRYKKEDIAAAVQKFLEKIAHDYVAMLVEKTGIKNICLSGGAAANVIMNLDIYENITKSIHITPAMADDGTAEGAIVFTMLERGFTMKDLSFLKGEAMPYYGTSYDQKSVRKAISKFGDLIDSEDLGESWPEKTAALVAAGKIGAIFHGRMEWGPRALGNRSIIADSRQKDFRDKINQTIKRRPVFQPFCPSILEEERDRLFKDAYSNRHMTCAFRMKEEFYTELPSAIHVDGTARVQFVNKNNNPAYFRLLTRVKELTGYGVVINTSFNKHGRTIVETPEDAIVDFLDTDMDYVIIEGTKVTRKNHA